MEFLKAFKGFFILGFLCDFNSNDSNDNNWTCFFYPHLMLSLKRVAIIIHCELCLQFVTNLKYY